MNAPEQESEFQRAIEAVEALPLDAQDILMDIVMWLHALAKTVT
jgi:hypothetical protein